MSNSAGISVLVISAQEDEVAAINTALREAGHIAHCSSLKKVTDLESAMGEHVPALLMLFAEPASSELKRAAKTRSLISVNTPILLVNDSIDEKVIATAMGNGARDVVSLSNIERLKAVASREIRNCRLENALERAMGSAHQFKQELQSLKQVTTEAIAVVQEGIIVNVNPAWADLFGIEETSDQMGLPIMDFCNKDDRPTLKGGLIACNQGKWSDSKLDIKGIRNNGESFPVSFSLESVEYDNEPAVRLFVAADKADDHHVPEIVIEQAIQRDQSTGFFNRNHFLTTLTQRIEQPPSGGMRAIAYMRPDKFSKAILDVGLLGTENIITQLAQTLREFMQPDDIYGRFGGTIFCFMLERGTMADAEAWAEQLLKTINSTVFEHDNQSTVLSCTIGLCELAPGDTSATQALNDAELACRTGRTHGGDCIQLSETSGAAKEVRQNDSAWKPRILSALKENRLRLEHQSVGSLNKDIEHSFDTLVRMLDEDGNTVLPSEFMPVAERTGLSRHIDHWVINASLAFCASSNTELVFVRLSRDSLLDKNLPVWLEKQAKKSKIAPNRVCFEIPEGICLKHLRQSQELATAVRKAGFKFAIEHVGKSDEAIKIISLVPMDYLKIDGSLMQGLHKNSGIQATVKEIASAAKAKNIMTVAERVQDANTMAVLWQLGISYLQGNYVQNQEIVMQDTEQPNISELSLAPDTETEIA